MVRSMARIQSKWKQEKGQSLTEFALSLPLLVVTLVGFVAMSYAFYAWIVMYHATTEGVSYAVRHPNATNQEIIDNGVKPNFVGLVGTPSIVLDRTGNQITITSYYTFNLPTIRIPLLLTNNSITISRPFSMQVTSIGFY
ncbi:hypothetical protein ARMA_2148 [Ardenticatena maritima]|uniref:TadE-like domain-containing protein n=2 Tax=Ardenticatena maritima TaxID=872965 RepID=A0A0M8K857_9CHLR|nr:hypothetical protein ARMA_2148 [Ardenticatena maritima]